jgi:hypothetical protein
MKRDRSTWISIVWFLLGSLVCYISVQFSFLEIDTKVNVAETIISLGTATIGLYIASSLQKTHNRNEKLSEYLQSKLDSAWDAFYNLSEQLQFNNLVPLTEITKTAKKLEQALSSQKKILIAFEIDTVFIDELSSSFDNLEDELTNNSVITNNIINFTANRATVIQKVDEVSQAFARGLRIINRIN